MTDSRRYGLLVELGQKFLAQADELASSLVLSEDSSPFLPGCVRGVQSLLGAELTIACEFIRTEAGIGAERLPTGNAAGERLRCARATMKREGPGASAPACPLATASPHPVVTLDEVQRSLSRHQADEMRHTLRESGLGRHDVLRVLVAHENEPLTCIAAFRGYRYDTVERRGIERIARALRQRLRLERRLREVPVADAGLAAAMEALHAPAFLVRSVNVVHANALGRARLEAHLDATREAIARAWAGHPPAGVEVTPVRSPGAPDHALIVLRAMQDDVEDRATLLAARWGLTRRQREVLAWVARGFSRVSGTRGSVPR
jgi:hypothetical protein